MSIFVSIACLLDNDIVNTIDNCLKQAYNKNKITIGVCYQKDEEDVLEPLEKKYKNLKVVRVYWKDAQGPMYARNKILSLITSEDYFLQIDCHTRFFKHWDRKLLDEYQLCLKQSDKPVISYYPININNMEKPEHLANIYHIGIFREVSINGLKTGGKRVNVPKVPLKGIGISAAMLFMPAKVVLENPIDPNLPFALHSGEQLLYAIRLWTRGYDFFTPTQHIIATEYITNKDRIDVKYRHYLNGQSGKHHAEVWKKVKYLLELGTYDGKIDDVWKAGKVRTVREYYDMTNIYDKLKALFPDLRC